MAAAQLRGDVLESRDVDEDDLFYQKLLLQTENEDKTQIQSNPAYLSVIPKPGFCLKTKADRDKKIFINVCTGNNLPEPRDISDEELMRLLDSDDPSGFRIPLSLGEPHAELDKSGNGCTAYDVLINPNFYERIQKRDALMGFFLTVALEGLENKYDIALDRNWRLLKNRRFVGSLPEQNIRSRSKPWIMEMNPDSSQSSRAPLISETSTTTCAAADQLTKTRKGEEPLYILMKEPAAYAGVGAADAGGAAAGAGGEGGLLLPVYLVAEVQLPKVKIAASLSLDVGEDRILLQTRSSVYHLDICLPYKIIQDDCVSQFNRMTKILTITMPVQQSEKGGRRS